jgi:hypothetical protein
MAAALALRAIGAQANTCSVAINVFHLKLPSRNGPIKLKAKAITIAKSQEMKCAKARSLGRIT